LMIFILKNVECWMLLTWISIYDFRMLCGLQNFWKTISIILDNKEDSIGFFKH
jgi:hypothetical protein